MNNFSFDTVPLSYNTVHSLSMKGKPAVSPSQLHNNLGGYDILGTECMASSKLYLRVIAIHHAVTHEVKKGEDHFPFKKISRCSHLAARKKCTIYYSIYYYYHQKGSTWDSVKACADN